MNIGAVLWRASAASYLRTLLRVVFGLATFRAIYQGLPTEDFGFWALLWSVFGYGVLVDFGLGFAAQKRVAELSVARDWSELSRVLSTMFFSFCAVAVLIFVGAYFGADALVRSMHASAANADRYREVALIFFVGMALGFPLGIFPEILRGLQRVDLVNLLVSCGLILNCTLILIGVWQGWGLRTLLLIALVTTLAPDVASAILVRRYLPEVRFSLRHFCIRTARYTMNFSLCAYAVTATNIVLGKTDQLVLGSCLSVAAVAVYVTGSKVADIFALFTRQLHEALSPAAAHLHASGDREGLRKLLVQGTRLSLLVAAPLYVLFAMRMDDFMRLLTGDAHPSAEARLTGELLLVWYLSTIATHATTKRIFIMTGHERRLVWLGLVEAVANVGCSIAFLHWYPHPTSVALGSLLPNLVIGWFVMWPWAAREANVTGLQLLRETILPGVLVSVPVALLLAAAGTLVQHRSLPITAVESAFAGLAALLCLWFLALNNSERMAIAARFPRLIPVR